MLLGLTDEQEALREAVQAMAERVWPLERVVEAAQLGELPPDGALWKELVAMGCAGLPLPAGAGGAGGTFVDLVVVLRELGRALAPEPLLHSTVAALLLAGCTAPAAGSVLRSVADGSARAVVVDAALEARPVAGGTLVRGTARHVAEAGGADLLVVAAAAGQEVSIVALARTDVDVTPVTLYDPTRAFADVDVDVVVAPDAVLATGREATRLLGAALRHRWVASAAGCTGAAARALDLAVRYARSREQFGRPIGSFQAIKHILADALVAVESAWSAVLYAGAALDLDPPDSELAIHAAAALATDALTQAAQTAVQVHGGLGFTMEVPAHLFLKRAKTEELVVGRPAFHRARIAEVLTACAPPTW